MNALAIESEASALAQRRLLSLRGEPLFYANWDNVIFMHFETEAEILQCSIPFQLDLRDGRAFVSLVAFQMRAMRPRIGGWLSEALVRPIASHNLLNLRTYVRHRGEPAIYFMREWVANRLSVLLGPSTFGLPYRYGDIAYKDDGLSGFVRARGKSFCYRATLPRQNFTACEPDSMSEFLLERYTAFTQVGLTKRFFRIWHERWRLAPADVEIIADDLVASSGEWAQSSVLIGANYSPGVDVWMGWPHLARKLNL